MSEAIYELETNSPDETRRLGESIGTCLSGGTVLALVGPLGAGKTHLVKGIAAGAATDGEVTSPTFTLVNEYSGATLLYHLDAYRLPNPQALADLGFDEMIRSDTAVLVEWADRVESVMPKDCLWIDLEPTGEQSRLLKFRPTGDTASDCLARLRQTYDNADR